MTALSRPYTFRIDMRIYFIYIDNFSQSTTPDILQDFFEKGTTVSRAVISSTRKFLSVAAEASYAQNAEIFFTFSLMWISC